MRRDRGGQRGGEHRVHLDRDDPVDNRQKREGHPSPGPTSITVSPAPPPASLTMRRTVLPSTTKFCPHALVGRMPWRAARSRTSAAPSSVASGRSVMRSP